MAQAPAQSGRVQVGSNPGPSPVLKQWGEKGEDGRGPKWRRGDGEQPRLGWVRWGVAPARSGGGGEGMAHAPAPAAAQSGVGERDTGLCPHPPFLMGNLLVP